MIQPRPHHADDGEDQNFARKGHHDVDATHEQSIASAAERTSKGAVKRADNGGDGHGGDGGKDRCTNPPK